MSTRDQRPVALVSGAHGEIGEALLERLDADGHLVVAGWRSGSRPAGPALRFDVTDAEAVDAAIRTVEGTWGPIGVVVANAGFAQVDLAVRTRPEAFRSVVDTNLTGAFLLARAALGPMVSRRAGRVVFIGSVAGLRGVPGMASYSAAKAGLEGLARSLAREVASRSITVNVVAPGMLGVGARRLTDARPSAGVEEAWIGATPLRRTGNARDIASAVSFLASPDAAAVTGATLAVDGGFSIGHHPRVPTTG